ncbi:hypothetical protein BJY00DRAFT_313640 [Aspergillus carlsbadensis]|nr:hypothetical protein BJY00DRAFT_313640 [Aspergillus carlsbadensis]
MASMANLIYTFPSDTDKPLTEAKKEHNRAVKRNADVSDEFNDLQLKLCCLLDDKIFLAESLRALPSQRSGWDNQAFRSRRTPRRQVAWGTEGDSGDTTKAIVCA